MHYEDLTPKQIRWWQEILTETGATAIAQCIGLGTPTYLLRQAIERGHAQGDLKAGDRDDLMAALAVRDGGCGAPRTERTDRDQVRPARSNSCCSRGRRR